MHEEQLITTTTATSKFSNSTIVNSTSLHQSTNDDGTITVSIVHQPHQLGDFATLSAAPCSTITNQISPSQTKIIDLQTLKENDVTSVIINGTISNTNDPNVLILPSPETCDSDKNALSLSQLTSLHSEQADIDLHDINSMNDETSSGEGESLDPFLSQRVSSSTKNVADADAVDRRKMQEKETIIVWSEQMKPKAKTRPRRSGRCIVRSADSRLSSPSVLLSHGSPVTFETLFRRNLQKAQAHKRDQSRSKGTRH